MFGKLTANSTVEAFFKLEVSVNQLTTKQFSSTEKIILLVSSIAFIATSYAFVTYKQSRIKFSKNETGIINYEMAKLNATESLYSLEDREIDLKYKAAQSAVNKNSVQKKQMSQKTETVKKTGAQSVAAQADLKKAKTNAAQVKNNKTNKLVSSDKNQNLDNAATEFTDQNTVAYQNINTVNAEAVAKEKEIIKKTYEQWKSEIFSSQSTESILKFSAAFRKNEITSQDFQKLISEMLNSENNKLIGLALYALRSTPSYASFNQLVAVQNTLNETYSSYVQDALSSYNQMAGLSILKQALASSDKNLVLKTLEIIKLGLINIQAGTVSELVDARYRRDIANNLFSMANYATFIPVLKDLVAHSVDQNIITLASQNINAIDDAQIVAAN